MTGIQHKHSSGQHKLTGRLNVRHDTKLQSVQWAVIQEISTGCANF